MKKYVNVSYGNGDFRRQVLDVYLPEAESFPVFVYFHGGGIEAGDKEHCVFYEDLCRMGVAIVTANYRMYPYANYPDFIWDAAAATAWAVKHMQEYGEVKGIYVGGSSAGGYLTQMLCFDKRYLALHKVDADEINGYFMDAGQPTAHFNVLKERGIDPRRVIVDESAPLYHVCAERNYPPMNIIVSDNDMRNRLEQTELLVSTLKHMGHEDKIKYTFVKNSKHCEYLGIKDENGVVIIANMINEFITWCEKEKK